MNEKAKKSKIMTKSMKILCQRSTIKHCFGTQYHVPGILCAILYMHSLLYRVKFQWQGQWCI